MSKQTIAGLVASGRLERIAPDPREALDLLGHAEKHLQSANRLLTDDPAASYQLLYDAARKAVAADMLTNGYRSKSDRPGAHAAAVSYAEIALAGVADADALSHFDQMRRSRNRSEYGGVTFSEAQIRGDLGYAAGIVEAVRRRLRPSA